MVRLISLLFVLFVLYLVIQVKLNKSETVDKGWVPSIITVEELPPMGLE